MTEQPRPTDEELKTGILERCLRAQTGHPKPSQWRWQSPELRQLFKLTDTEDLTDGMKARALEARHALEDLGYLVREDDQPCWRLTATGVGVAKGETAKPRLYDDASYFGELSKDVPNLDAVALEYLKEAVGAFNQALPLSATVMLGVASELVMKHLIRAWAKKAGDAKLEADVDKQKIASTVKNFLAKLEQDRTVILDTQKRSDLKAVVDGTFQFIRLSRNDAGHGQRVVQPPSRAIIYSQLLQFHFYVKRIYETIDKL